jgi:O-antigen/teichoic acid export membrane protein
MMLGALRQIRGDTLRARAMRGSALTITSFAAGNVFRLASNLILTRILFPEAFGLMALVSVFITSLHMFSDIGLKTSVIRSERGDDPRFLNTAWTVQVIRGCILWLGAVAIAGPVANFYDQPQLQSLIAFVGIQAFFLGFLSINFATVNRKLLLGRLTLLELGTQLLGIGVMIGAALVLQSVWALAIGGVTGTAAKVVLSHFVLPGRRARFQIDHDALWEVIHFGKWIFLSTIAAFLLQHSDRAILGKFIPLADLALYNIAFTLATMPTILQTALVGRVLFPLYVNKPPRESDENRAKVLQARLAMTGVTFALTVPFLFYGRELIELMYDPRYYGAGPIVAAIAFVWLFRAIVAGYDSVLLAAGDSRSFAVLLIGSAGLRTSLILLGAATYGVPGVLLAALLSELIIYPFLVWTVRRYRVWDWRQDLCFALLACVLVALVLWRDPTAWQAFVSLATVD